MCAMGRPSPTNLLLSDGKSVFCSLRMSVGTAIACLSPLPVVHHSQTTSARQVGRHCLDLRSLSITAGTASMTFANVTTLTALRYLNLSHSDGVAVAALRSLER